MRKVSLGGALAAMALVGLVAACDDPGSKLPLGPTPPSTSIEISGPASIAPGQSAQFTVNIRMSDGTLKSLTGASAPRWRISNPFSLQVNASGLVTGGQRGEGVVTADVTLPGGARQSTKEVVVLPDGTYRMVGVVSEAGFPTVRLAGARVEVTPGPIVATATSSGEYRLYGVPADATVRVTAAGYQPHDQSLRLTGHATQDFPLTLSGTRLDLAGNYTIAIEAVGACSGNPALAMDLRQRTYAAVLTQNGPTLDVALTEPRFRLNSAARGNKFSGRVTASGATFTLDDYYYYFGTALYPSIAEQLSNGTVLVVSGSVVATASAAGLSGPMNGLIANYNSGFPAARLNLGTCFSQAHRFTMTRR